MNSRNRARGDTDVGGWDQSAKPCPLARPEIRLMSYSIGRWWRWNPFAHCQSSNSSSNYAYYVLLDPFSHCIALSAATWRRGDVARRRVAHIEKYLDSRDHNPINPFHKPPIIHTCMYLWICVCAEIFRPGSKRRLTPKLVMLRFNDRL